MQLVRFAGSGSPFSGRPGRFGGRWDNPAPDTVQNILASIGKNGTGKLEIFVAGDSHSDGYGVTAVQAWPNVLAEKLRAAVGYPSKPDSRYYTANGIGGDSWTYGGAASTDQVLFGLGFRNRNLVNTSTATLVFTGTDIDVYMTRAFGQGGGTYTIDGGAPVAFTSVITKRTIDSAPCISVTGLSAASHTIVITATGAVALEGAYVYNGDRANGIHVWEGAHAGYACSDYATMYGYNINSDYANPPNGVDLIVFPIGINDWQLDHTKATYKKNLRQVVSMLRQTNAKVPIVLVKDFYIAQFANADDPDWGHWRDITDQVATEYGCAVWDFYPVIGSLDVGQNNVYDSGDFRHCNAAGHAVIAEYAKNQIVGGLRPPYNTNVIPAQIYQDDAPNLLAANQDLTLWTSANTPVMTTIAGVTIDGSQAYGMQDNNAGGGEGKYMTLPTLLANRRYRITIHFDCVNYTIASGDAEAIILLYDPTFFAGTLTVTSSLSVCNVVPVLAGTLAALGITDSYACSRRVSPFDANYDILSLDFTVGSVDAVANKLGIYPASVLTNSHQATMRFARPTLQLLPYGA